jgi:hypothetical protein
MKTAQVIFIILVLLYFPVTVSAANTDIANNVWTYPSRSVDEIVSWFKKETTPTPSVQQVLGVKDLTNAPVIQEFIETPDLGVKLDSTGSSLEKLYLDYQLILSETVLMGLNWDNLTVSDITQTVDKQIATLNSTTQTLDALGRSWGWSQTDSINTSINSIKTGLGTVRTITTSSGVTPIAYDQLKAAVKELEAVTVLIGDKSDTGTGSLYAKYSGVVAGVGKWNDLLAQLDNELVASSSAGLPKIESQVLALNQIPKIASLLSKERISRALELAAVINANKSLLAQDRGQTVVTTWLENAQSGNTVFKSLVVNPSILARQEVLVKYYLPAELQESDIVYHDPSLEITMDKEKGRLLAEGKIVMAANDRRIVTVETRDVWNFDSSSLDATNAQIVALLDAMSGSANFVQAVSLKGKIVANIKKIQLLQQNQGGPEQKIKTYRQIVLIAQDMNSNLSQLEKLTKMQSNPTVDLDAWKNIATIVAGVAFVVVGLGMIQNKGMSFKYSHKAKVKANNINVFTSGIATSDL